MSYPSRVLKPEAHATIEEVSTHDEAHPAPGPLHGTVALILQTSFAQRLVNGRKHSAEKHGVLGLFGFAQLLRRIWVAAEAADPYAEWWLIKVERALAEAESELKEGNDKLLAELSNLEAMSIEPASSARAVRVGLKFSSTHAFRGAQLIARADKVARIILTARHVGCLPGQAASTALWKVGHAVRRAFGCARGYTSTSISRTELLDATPRAAYAVQQMGVLPKEILDESVMPAYRPRRKSPVSNRKDLAAPVDPVSEGTVLLFADALPLNDESISFDDDLIDLFPSSC